jgi:hypothetical protein
MHGSAWIRGVSAAAATLVIALGLVAGAGAAPPTTETIHFTETFVDTDIGCEEVVDITVESKGVIHETIFGDPNDPDSVHVTGTFVGTFSFVEAGVTYSGRFTGWFGLNANSKNFVATDTFRANGRGSDGSHVRFQFTGHFSVNANGEVTVDFAKERGGCR